MKKFIYLIIIIIGLGGALVMGYLVYKGSTQGLPSTEVATSTPDSNAYQILPYGRDLDFQKVEEYNKNKILFPYPKVTPSEIGTSSTSMME